MRTTDAERRSSLSWRSNSIALVYLRERKDGGVAATYEGHECRGEDYVTSTLLITEDTVRVPLHEVINPDVGENLVDLGRVFGVHALKCGHVHAGCCTRCCTKGHVVVVSRRF